MPNASPITAASIGTAACRSPPLPSAKTRLSPINIDAVVPMAAVLDADVMRVFDLISLIHWHPGGIAEIAQDMEKSRVRPVTYINLRNRSFFAHGDESPN